MFTLFVSLETPLNSGRALQFTFPETNFDVLNVMVDTAGATSLPLEQLLILQQ